MKKSLEDKLLKLLGSGYDHTNALGTICSSDCEEKHSAKDVFSIVKVFIDLNFVQRK